MARVEERRLWVRLMSKDALRNYMDSEDSRRASELAEWGGVQQGDHRLPRQQGQGQPHVVQSEDGARD